MLIDIDKESQEENECTVYEDNLIENDWKLKYIEE